MSAQTKSRDTTTAALNTELLLGAGIPSGEAWHLTPAFTAGFQVTPRDSRVSFRLVAEHWEHESMVPGDAVYNPGLWSSQQSDGVQLLGVRNFGSRRVQFHALAGLGVYTTRSVGRGPHYVYSDSGFVFDGFRSWNTSETRTTLIWGVGSSVRLGGMRIFGEMKLPLYHNRAFSAGPAAPLLFGIRF